MSVRKTIQIGNPKLKAENQTISDASSTQVKDLIMDLVDTMRDNGLIGIAAPQIGENYKVFVTEPRETETRPADQADELRIYINPEIVEMAEEEIIIYEGCGSVLNGALFGPVSRPKWVKIKAMDTEGNWFTFKADGILGRVIQHEYDHLIGEEFTEKITDYKQLMARKHYVEQIKSQKWHKQNGVITLKEYEHIS